MVSLLNENITRGHSLKLNKLGCLKSLRQNAFPARSVHVFTGSDLITGSNRIGPDRARNWLFSSFLKHFFIIIMFIKYIYMIIIMMSGSSRSETIATI